MAKHPHKLTLVEKRTWRCALDGCSFFVHLGLQHVLLGKRALCWECDDIYVVDAFALREDMPRCTSCRSQGETMTPMALDEWIKQKQEMRKKQHAPPIKEKEVTEEDVIEVYEPEHTPDCASFTGASCDCGIE